MWLDSKRFEEAGAILADLGATEGVERILGPGPFSLATQDELPELLDVPLGLSEWSDGETSAYRLAVEGRLAVMLVGPVRALVVPSALLLGGLQ
jgi:hypothetical protein